MRVWTLVTVGVFVVIFAVGVRAILQSMADRRLLREGVRVEATIEQIAGGTRNQTRAVARLVTLTFLLPGETERRELNLVVLPASAQGGAISKGDKLPILVNPKDPRVWTDRTEPASWIIVLAVPLLLLPIALLLAFVTVLARRRMTRLYEQGTLRQANVIDAHRSALVPRQKVVKLGVGGGRVLSAAYPDALGPITNGDTIDAIINNEARPTLAIVARAYTGEPTN